MGEAGDGQAPPRDVMQLAQRFDFGAPRGTRALGGGDVGCLDLGLAVVLLPPGIGLVAGPYGAAVTGLGAAFLAIAVALVPLTLRHVTRRDDRIPRLHLFDRGIVLTRPPEIAACPWTDIRLVEHTQSAAIGQGGATLTVNRLRLEHIDGGVLCSMGASAPLDEIACIAIAGRAHT
ncbi:hypothetical protein [Streptomyces sp. NRRL S-813]|uniref:hypothetical protein n=1 Tax=Streptomyces sp. NRRL S-813 TaxID=1463919 RepID=UPI00131B10D7|nr:hypothetical protein [Streptomyces sp. NRRL S-813]